MGVCESASAERPSVEEDCLAAAAAQDAEERERRWHCPTCQRVVADELAEKILHDLPDWPNRIGWDDERRKPGTPSGVTRGIFGIVDKIRRGLP